jgi:hypothetical protein
MTGLIQQATLILLASLRLAPLMAFTPPFTPIGGSRYRAWGDGALAIGILGGVVPLPLEPALRKHACSEQTGASPHREMFPRELRALLRGHFIPLMR